MRALVSLWLAILVGLSTD